MTKKRRNGGGPWGMPRTVIGFIAPEDTGAGPRMLMITHVPKGTYAGVPAEAIQVQRWPSGARSDDQAPEIYFWQDERFLQWIEGE